MKAELRVFFHPSKLISLILLLLSSSAHASDVCDRLYRTVSMEARYQGENRNGVEYFSPERRERSRMLFKEGRLMDARGHAVDGRGLWVMDPNGEFYFTQEDRIGKIHHSSLLSGAPVAAAGTFRAQAGALLQLTDFSGHYQPAKGHIKQAILEMEKRGVSFENTHLRSFQVEEEQKLKVVRTSVLGATAISGGIYAGVVALGGPSESLDPEGLALWLRELSPSVTQAEAERIAKDWKSRGLTQTQFDEIKKIQRALESKIEPVNALKKAEYFVLTRKLSSEATSRLLIRLESYDHDRTFEEALVLAEKEL